MYIHVYTMRIGRPTRNVLEVKTQIEGEEIHVREVSKFGNGAKINFIKDFIGEKVIVIVLKNKGDKNAGTT